MSLSDEEQLEQIKSFGKKLYSKKDTQIFSGLNLYIHFILVWPSLSF